MSLNKIQKRFVKLVNNRHSKWLSRYPARRYRAGKWSPSSTSIKIINAVTGEITTAKSKDDNPTTLKRWLKIRNMRATFQEMLIKKNSTWSRLLDDEFKNYPVIVKLGRYQVPYIIEHVGDRLTYNGKTTCTVFLETTDNINYLSIISEKKKLLVNSPKPVKIAVVKKKQKKAKRRKKRFNYGPYEI